MRRIGEVVVGIRFDDDDEDDEDDPGITHNEAWRARNLSALTD